jgi:hypothetical protein
MDFMKAALAGKDPGRFQPPPLLPPTPVAVKLDTQNEAPGEDESH